MVTYLGDLYLSNGDRIVRPGGYLAFLVIASAANLIIGLLLAVIRIVLLLLTTILAVGRTDVSVGMVGQGGWTMQMHGGSSRLERLVQVGAGLGGPPLGAGPVLCPRCCVWWLEMWGRRHSAQ